MWQAVNKSQAVVDLAKLYYLDKKHQLLQPLEGESMQHTVTMLLPKVHALYANHALADTCVHAVVFACVSLCIHSRNQ